MIHNFLQPGRKERERERARERKTEDHKWFPHVLWIFLHMQLAETFSFRTRRKLPRNQHPEMAKVQLDCWCHLCLHRCLGILDAPDCHSRSNIGVTRCQKPKSESTEKRPSRNVVEMSMDINTGLEGMYGCATVNPGSQSPLTTNGRVFKVC